MMFEDMRELYSIYGPLLHDSPTMHKLCQSPGARQAGGAAATFEPHKYQME